MERRSKKYNDVINTGFKLFSRYGIKRVTIEEICAEANVSKMTFYKYFPNKVALVKAILLDYYEYWMDRCREVMYSELPFSEKLSKILEIKIESTKESGKDFIFDLCMYPEGVFKEYIENRRKEGIKETIELFTYAQEKGWISSDLKPALLLMLIDKVTEIALDENAYKIYGNVSELNLAVTRFFLYGVVERPQ